MNLLTTSYLEALSDNIVVDPRKCIFCGKCADTCILDNIRVQLAPCRVACPLHTNCQGYVQLIGRGDDQKAMQVLAEALPFPGILGRVCSHPCEDACSRREVDGQAVAIRDLKRYLADGVALPPVEVKADRPQKVAIVGAGPAGAMAAYLLRREGFQVTLYDANERAGGMLATGVPEFRLPTAVLDGEMAVLTQLGVALRLGVRVGADAPLAELVENNDAVLLATGAHVSKRLGLAGEDLPGIYDGLAFLRAARSEAAPAVGQKVVVIGGGNTAVDAAQTAHRLGAASVTIVCLEQRSEMPAFAWEVEDALEEGIAVLNGWGPAAFVPSEGTDEVSFTAENAERAEIIKEPSAGSATSAVNGLVLRRCLSVFQGKRFAPTFDDADRRQLEADTVVVAIGQDVDLSFVGGLVPTANGRLAADPVTMQSQGTAKVFAAGDALTGPKTVVEALASGKEAAESIRRYLLGESLTYGRAYLGPYETEFPVDKSQAVARPRVALRQADEAARRTFAELQQSMATGEARAEAERCLSCGQAYGKFRNCWYCLPCEIECPEEALRVEIPYLLR